MKKCPFCGEKPIIWFIEYHQQWVIRCTSEKHNWFEFTEYVKNGNKEKARRALLEKWNARAAI